MTTAKTMNRAEIITFVTEASRRPRPAIVEKISYLHDPTGKTYTCHNFPLGLSHTACTRFVSGYAYQDTNGTRYAPTHFTTAEDAAAWLDRSDERHTADIFSTFSPMTDSELASQYDFWKKETERYSYKRLRSA